jgi:hypothetical protein
MYAGAGPKPIQLRVGWMLAVFVVGVAVFGPSLTGQSIPALVEIRHAILMIDREFERWPTRADTYGAESMILGETSNDG